MVLRAGLGLVIALSLSETGRLSRDHRWVRVCVVLGHTTLLPRVVGCK